MFTTQINIPKDDRTQLADLLNQQLADLSDLSSQTKQAHWNVRGRHFYQYHKLFEELTDVVEERIDEVAERIATLGGYAKGSVRHVAEATRLDDFPSDQGSDQGYIDVLSGRFSFCANQMRRAVMFAEELSDTTTAELLTSISRALDKSLWLLEAHMRPVRGHGESDDTTRDRPADAVAVPSRVAEPRQTRRTHRAAPKPRRPRHRRR